MREPARELLIDEASRLFGEADALVPIAKAGKPVPAELLEQITRADLIWDYIRAQEGDDPNDYRLPEPILHPVFPTEILVVGLNPNDGPLEEIPRLRDGLDHYINFYSTRFDPARRFRGSPAGQDRAVNGVTGKRYVIDHYDRVEDLLGPVLGRSQVFGTVATYCDAIPWKWKNGFKGLGRNASPSDWVLASSRVGRIINALKPKVVLTLSDPGKTIFGHRMSPTPAPAKPAYNPDWSVWHVASYHPNPRWGDKFGLYAPQVQDALTKALELS